MEDRGVGLLENPTMDDNLARRRRVSAAAELGASASLKDGELIDVYPARESHPGPGRVGAAAAAAAAAWGMERRNSVPPGSHQRHMPMEPLKMTIPRKNKEKKGGLICILHTNQYYYNRHKQLQFIYRPLYLK